MELDQNKRSASPQPEKAFSTSFPLRLDQSHEAFDGSVTPCLGYQCAQVFVPEVSGVLRYVELLLAVTKGDSCHARVGLLTANRGLPLPGQDSLIAYTDACGPLVSGWSTFRFPKNGISVTAGRSYALLLEPASLCDWRVQFGASTQKTAALCHRWDAEAWQQIQPTATAAFRTYVEAFRSSDWPSCR